MRDVVSGQVALGSRPGGNSQDSGARPPRAAVEAARGYDDWYATPQGSGMARAEEMLLDELLDQLGRAEEHLRARIAVLQGTDSGATSSDEMEG